MNLTLIAFVAVNFLAALSGAFFKPDAWFRTLEKPSWQPPDWAFPLVWTLLYSINAVSGWLIWEREGASSSGITALTIYGLSLLLNASWSAVFFGMKRLDWAKISAFALAVSVALQMVVFYQLVPLAGLILIPYLLWVMVATALSARIQTLNPQG
ncbi:MAG: TspO/MBR family protein [Pseudomonadota bacterium]